MNDAAGAELTERQRYWLEQIKACEVSGVSASAYAAEQGFHVGGMYAGKKSLIRKGVLRQTAGARFRRVQAKVVSIDTSGVSGYRTVCRWSFPAQRIADHYRRF